ncbi:MAG: hypothetical protein QOD69_2336 [Solirubrobacteraceae bacterium]|jgi:hypothetical protein|nr:hypothetical protein [Solirubrobacteraceae bacterium]
MPAARVALDVRAFAVAAEAAEVIERPALLATFAERFGPADDATLVLLSDELSDVPELLLRAAAAVGLGEDDLPDLLVVPLADRGARDGIGDALHATLTERGCAGALAALPRHGIADGAALQRLGRARIASATVRDALPKGLALPAGYASRIPPEYFDDFSRPEVDIVHQPDVYAAAAKLARAMGATHIIDVGSGAGAKLLPLAPEFRLVGVDYGSNLERCRVEHPQHTWLRWDAETEPFPAIPSAVVARSIVICADVIEHLVDPSGLLVALSGLADHAAAILISTPDRLRVRGAGDPGPPGNRAHVREWALDELCEVLATAGLEPAFAGYTINNDRDCEKKTSLAIVDRRHAGPIAPAPDDFRVTAVLPAYNEADVVEHAILTLVRQGVHVRLVDNWSTDDTVARAEALGLGDALTVERFPASGPSATYDWEALLHNTERIARELGDGWVIHQDVDEVRRSPWPGVSLRDALWHVQQLGYDAVDHTSLAFVPTDDDFRDGDDMERVLRHFEFGARPGHFIQVKAWDARAGAVDLASSGGHEARFPGRRVFPYKFLQKHYPIRSQAHGERKVFADRTARWNAGERARGWHSHYDAVAIDERFVRAAEDLLAFDAGFEREYLLERLLGIGIVRGA